MLSFATFGRLRSSVLVCCWMRKKSVSKIRCFAYIMSQYHIQCATIPHYSSHSAIATTLWRCSYHAMTPPSSPHSTARITPRQCTHHTTTPHPPYHNSAPDTSWHYVCLVMAVCFLRFQHSISVYIRGKKIAATPARILPQSLLLCCYESIRAVDQQQREPFQPRLLCT